MIERVIGDLKRYGVLSGRFRGTASELNQKMDIIGGLHNLKVIQNNLDTYGPILQYIEDKIKLG